jgi:hypothetical protein
MMMKANIVIDQGCVNTEMFCLFLSNLSENSYLSVKKKSCFLKHLIPANTVAGS